LPFAIVAWALGCAAPRSPEQSPPVLAVPHSESVEAPREESTTPAAPEPPSSEVLQQARALLDEIGRSALMAFQREEMGARGKVVSRKLCPSSKPVPSNLTALAPAYNSTEAEWLDDFGWRCLKLSVEEPLRCQFAYESDAKSFVTSARCPGSGMVRELWLRGSIEGRELRISGEIEERDVAH
jgi:hypothetical protein